jgi:ribosomal protein L6P/L9E
MLSNVTVTRSEKVKDELILEGNDIELVSRSAALINQVLSLTNFEYWYFRLFDYLVGICHGLTIYVEGK